MRRYHLIAVLAAMIVTAPLAADAQDPPGNMQRIGFLGATDADDLAKHLDALRQGLRDLGYVEGKNIVIEYRWAVGNYDRLPALAADLVRLNMKVIVTHGTPGSLAAKQATKEVPIVMAVSGDAVATGLVQSIARPGGNITGSTFFFPELNAKRLELIKEAAPRIRRVGVLLNPANSSHVPALQAMEVAATALQLELRRFEARTPGELAGAFSAMAERRIEAIEVIDDRMLIANAATIAKLAMTEGLPLVGPREVMAGGGLMAYAVDFLDMYRRAAIFVRQDPQRRQAGRPADRAADQIRAGDQPQDRQSARPHHPAVAARSRRRGDRVTKALLQHLLHCSQRAGPDRRCAAAQHHDSLLAYRVGVRGSCRRRSVSEGQRECSTLATTRAGDPLQKSAA